MGSKRDRFKKLNQDRSEETSLSENEIKPVTIVDELADNYEKQESAKDPVTEDNAVESINQIKEREKYEQIIKEDTVSSPVVEKNAPKEPAIIKVIDKSNVGRPKVLQGVYKPISARLKLENYEHARLVGGRYGGMNGYINYLIEQDMKKDK